MAWAVAAKHFIRLEISQNLKKQLDSWDLAFHIYPLALSLTQRPWQLLAIYSLGRPSASRGKDSPDIQPDWPGDLHTLSLCVSKLAPNNHCQKIFPRTPLFKRFFPDKELVFWWHAMYLQFSCILLSDLLSIQIQSLNCTWLLTRPMQAIPSSQST